MKIRFNPVIKGCFAAVLLASVGNAAAATTLNALFMTQAAYSENDIRAMTQEFQKAHPDVQVNLEFVPYEALHDKIVAARGAGGRPSRPRRNALQGDAGRGTASDRACR